MRPITSLADFDPVGVEVGAVPRDYYLPGMPPQRVKGRGDPGGLCDSDITCLPHG